MKFTINLAEHRIENSMRCPTYNNNRAHSAVNMPPNCETELLIELKPDFRRHPVFICINYYVIRGLINSNKQEAE